jgi:tRNA(Ile)-lysidine synthase
MLNEFLKYIELNNLAGKGDRILMAVSGGIDSMVMADLFIKGGFNVGIAHCNFCLRGEESEKDELLVKDLAIKHNIPFYPVRFNTSAYAAEKKISIQMAARELRYEWFEKIRVENAFTSVAVAHNMNDNAETLLLNLTRGTGIAGLTGIKNRSGNIIRPLLFADRKSISGYCAENLINFREDASNSGTKYARNKIRHLVIPELEKINPSVVETLNETTERMASTNSIVNYFTDRQRNKLISSSAGKLSVKIRSLKPYLDNRTLIYELFKPFGITGTLADDLISIAGGDTGSQVFTESHRFLRNRGEILITPVNEIKDENYLINNPEEIASLSFVKSVQMIDKAVGFKIPRAKESACLDLDKISFPVEIRKWAPGDYFFPLGMTKKKKLSDYFIDARISRIDKEKILVMESGGKICWIVGERMDDRFKVTGTTRRILFIKLKKI